MDVAFEHLLKNFQASDKAQWMQAARAELKEKPLESISCKGAGEKMFHALFDHTDVASLSYLEAHRLAPNEESYYPPRHWYNQPPVRVESEQRANNMALDHLGNGADGVLFIPDNALTLNVPALLKGIQLPYCRVSFLVTSPSTFALLTRSLTDSLLNDIRGDLFVSGFTAADVPGLATLLDQCPHLCLGLWSEAGDNSAQALVKITHTAVQALVAGANLHRLAFSLPATGDFLQDVAGFKALRILLDGVAAAFQVPAATMHLHAHTHVLGNDQYQPHGNMISSTIAAMAAITGGADALSVFPDVAQGITAARIARNVSNLLREESHFDKVADPLAGAYALDARVDDLTVAAWNLLLNRLSS